MMNEGLGVFLGLFACVTVALVGSYAIDHAFAQQVPPPQPAPVVVSQNVKNLGDQWQQLNQAIEAASIQKVRVFDSMNAVLAELDATKKELAEAQKKLAELQPKVDKP